MRIIDIQKIKPK